MITLGVDAHKRTHTIVAVDTTGRQLATVTVAATSEGHFKALRWAARFTPRRWAIEDCRPVTRRLERDLLGTGETAVRVPPKLMAQSRTSARTVGKSDPIDALAIARAALRHDDLPEAHLDGHERVVRIVSDRRDVLVAEKTRLVNRLRWRLHELDPTNVPPSGGFNRRCILAELTGQFTQWAHSPDPVVATNATIGLDELERITQLVDQVRHLEQLLTEQVTTSHQHLLDIVGIGAINAAAIVGHIGNIDRFATEDKFAALVATAPIPVSSGNHHRYRLNHGGNRYLNAVIHRIAITQLAHYQPAKNLVAAATTRGKTKKEAIRILKRHITRAIYTHLKEDQQTHNHHQQPTAA